MTFVETCEYTTSRDSLPGRGRKSVVTGAAGFIGSHLTDLLLKQGNEVVGLDSFDPASSPDQRAGNLLVAGNSPSFRPRVDDLRTADLVEVFSGSETVYHLAARPGVQDSWGADGPRTWADNVAATQAVLEAALAAGVRRVVLASSSSVYGDTAGHHGKRIMAPTSPYGASKAACEHLAGVYAPRGLEIVTLRYFTVFGPRQRPDMAMHRIFEAARPGWPPFVRRGSGNQTREFTFVRDVAEATAAAGVAPGAAGRTLDIGAGTQASLNEVIAAVEALTGTAVRIVTAPRPAGDPEATVAAGGPARRVLGWWPKTSLHQGLAEQWAWHLGRSASHGRSRRGPQASARSAEVPQRLHGAWMAAAT